MRYTVCIAMYWNCKWQHVLNTILNRATPDDVRSLCATVDEYNRRGQFERAFPPDAPPPEPLNASASTSPSKAPRSAVKADEAALADSFRYLQLFEQSRYYNFLLAAFYAKFRTPAKLQVGLLSSVSLLSLNCSLLCLCSLLNFIFTFYQFIFNPLAGIELLEQYCKKRVHLLSAVNQTSEHFVSLLFH